MCYTFTAVDVRTLESPPDKYKNSYVTVTSVSITIIRDFVSNKEWLVCTVGEDFVRWVIWI